MEETQKNNLVWYIAGVVIIALAAYWLFFRAPNAVAPNVDDHQATTTSSATAATGEALLMINDQFNTTMAIVDRVVTKAPAWVVVHEDQGGKPGRILGAAWVPAGETLNLRVEFINGATAVEGQTYYAMIHTDNGDGGINFDPKTDLPLSDSTGQPIMKAFKVIFDKG